MFVFLQTFVGLVGFVAFVGFPGFVGLLVLLVLLALLVSWIYLGFRALSLGFRSENAISHHKGCEFYENQHLAL